MAHTKKCQDTAHVGVTVPIYSPLLRRLIFYIFNTQCHFEKRHGVLRNRSQMRTFDCLSVNIWLRSENHSYWLFEADIKTKWWRFFQHFWEKKKTWFRCISFLTCQEADRKWWHISVLLLKKKEYTTMHNSRIIFFFSVMFVFPLCTNYRVPMIWIFGYLQSYRLLLTPSQVFMRQSLSWVGSVLNTVFSQRR